jgi:hypothetical protein
MFSNVFSPFFPVSPFRLQVWPCCAALAQHVATHPELVRRRRVFEPLVYIYNGKGYIWPTKDWICLRDLIGVWNLILGICNLMRSDNIFFPQKNHQQTELLGNSWDMFGSNIMIGWYIYMCVCVCMYIYIYITNGEWGDLATIIRNSFLKPKSMTM